MQCGTEEWCSCHDNRTPPARGARSMPAEESSEDTATRPRRLRKVRSPPVPPPVGPPPSPPVSIPFRTRPTLPFEPDRPSPFEPDRFSPPPPPRRSGDAPPPPRLSPFPFLPERDVARRGSPPPPPLSPLVDGFPRPRGHHNAKVRTSRAPRVLRSRTRRRRGNQSRRRTWWKGKKRTREKRGRKKGSEGRGWTETVHVGPPW